MVKQRPVILIDTREQRPLTFSFRVDTQRATLPSGDYSIAGATEFVSIERKSLADLVQCCSWEVERFYEGATSQMGRLGRDYRWRALCIEATREAIHSKSYIPNVKPQCIEGLELAIEINRGVPVHHFYCCEEMARFVEAYLIRVLATVQAIEKAAAKEAQHHGERQDESNDATRRAG